VQPISVLHFLRQELTFDVCFHGYGIVLSLMDAPILAFAFIYVLACVTFSLTPEDKSYQGDT